MTTKKRRASRKEKVVAVVYRDKRGNVKTIGDDLEELEWVEVRPPNRKRRKSA